jgi:hypothetical protein
VHSLFKQRNTTDMARTDSEPELPEDICKVNIYICFFLKKKKLKKINKKRQAAYVIEAKVAASVPKVPGQRPWAVAAQGAGVPFQASYRYPLGRFRRGRMGNANAIIISVE